VRREPFSGLSPTRRAETTEWVAGRRRGMTSALQDLLERHVASGTVPGVVASLGTAELKVVAAGAMSVGGAPMRADAIMRMQSMTKAVTTVAALRLVE